MVLIERRTLIREGLVSAFAMHLPQRIVSSSSYKQWVEEQRDHGVEAFIYSAAGARDKIEIDQEVSFIAAHGSGSRAVVIAETDELEQVIRLLNAGARGVIPTSAPLTVAVEAIRLVLAGGTYLPASSVMGARNGGPLPNSRRPRSQVFTSRQLVVIEALRRGMSNKRIAYELNMRESTVKVHVRNIMKKLGAKNRTEAAFIVSKQLQEASNNTSVPTASIPATFGSVSPS